MRDRREAGSWAWVHVRKTCSLFNFESQSGWEVLTMRAINVSKTSPSLLGDQNSALELRVTGPSYAGMIPTTAPTPTRTPQKLKQLSNL